MENGQSYAVVFGGGGMRGVYEAGGWKAILESGIKIDGVIGTSIGAINAAFAVQGTNGANIEDIYMSIEFEDLIGKNNFDPNYDVFHPRNFLKLLKGFVKNHGYDTKYLEEFICKFIDVDKIYDSPIDLGVVIYTTKLIPLVVFKSEIPKERFVKYILASAGFPIFKPIKIEGYWCLDGGFWSNVAIDEANKWEKDTIAFDLKSIGRNRNPKNEKKVKVFVIRPSGNLGGLFEVNKAQIKKNLDMGYADTKKTLRRMKIFYQN